MGATAWHVVRDGDEPSPSPALDDANLDNAGNLGPDLHSCVKPGDSMRVIDHVHAANRAGNASGRSVPTRTYRVEL